MDNIDKLTEENLKVAFSYMDIADSEHCAKVDYGNTERIQGLIIECIKVKDDESS